MPTRSYRMVERARSVERTRAAILDAAGRLFASERYAHVSLDDIALGAGVSRGTVYHQFGSRQGLIEALTTATEERAGFARVLAAAEQQDPASSLLGTCTELVSFVHDTAPLFDNLRALAQLETDLRQMVERKDAARRQLMDEVVSRVARADGLRVPSDRARAIVAALSSYEALRELLVASPSVSAAQDHVRWSVEQLLREPADATVDRGGG